MAFIQRDFNSLLIGQATPFFSGCLGLQTMVLAHDAWHIPSPLHLQKLSFASQTRETARLLARKDRHRSELAEPRLLLLPQCLPSTALPSGSVCAPICPRNAHHLPNIDTRITGSLYASNYLLAFWSESRLNWHCENSRPSFIDLVCGLACGWLSSAFSVNSDKQQHKQARPWHLPEPPTAATSTTTTPHCQFLYA